MTGFDLIVFGGGTGNTVASAAAAEGVETALIEKGPLGGLCLNRGCNPSKMLIQHANRINRIRDADRFSIDASIENVRFSEFVRDVNAKLADAAEKKRTNKRDEENLTLFQEVAQLSTTTRSRSRTPARPTRQRRSSSRPGASRSSSMRSTVSVMSSFSPATTPSSSKTDPTGSWSSGVDTSPQNSATTSNRSVPTWR